MQIILCLWLTEHFSVFFLSSLEWACFSNLGLLREKPVSGTKHIKFSNRFLHSLCNKWSCTWTFHKVSFPLSVAGINWRWALLSFAKPGVALLHAVGLCLHAGTEGWGRRWALGNCIYFLHRNATCKTDNLELLWTHTLLLLLLLELLLFGFKLEEIMWRWLAFKDASHLSDGKQVLKRTNSGPLCPSHESLVTRAMKKTPTEPIWMGVWQDLTRVPVGKAQLQG